VDADDAEDAEDVVVQNVDPNIAPLVWHAYDDIDPYEPDWMPPYSRQRSVLVDTSDFNPVDYFKLFFPNEVFEVIAEQTNNYSMIYFDQTNDISKSSRFATWKETNPQEMHAYVALQLSMGLVSKPYIEDYWNRNCISATPGFGEVMARNRFELLNSFLHFADVNDYIPRGEEGYDPMQKIRPILDIVDPTYLNVYCPGQKICIDETMIKFKGRLYFKQFMPAKPTRWGIKQFALSESKTGYLLKCLTYTGQSTFPTVPGVGMTEQVCVGLCEGFENFGHKLYVDNFYTSPSLFLKLKDSGIGCCGTARAGRKHMPRDIHPNILATAKGDPPIYMRSDDLIACAWHDTKRLTMLSTIHTNNVINKVIRSRNHPGGRRDVDKPVMVEDYNQHMSGVDIMDQRLGTYAYPHKCYKWYMAVYHRVREVAASNGYVIYRTVAQREGDKVMTPKEFRKQVIAGLLEDYVKPTRNTPIQGLNAQTVNRLEDRHFMAKYDIPNYRPDCTVCSERPHNRKQTKFYCMECNKPFCGPERKCFRIYHSYNDFKTAAAALL
jgi:hypothetical protein